MKNSRGWQLWDTFWVLKGVHFMYTICFFEAREVRSPTLQTVHKLELERRSYGHLKTTAQSWAKWVAKISQGLPQLQNHPLAHECHFTAPPPHFAAAKWAVKWPAKMFLGCEMATKLALGCKMASKLWIKLRNHLQVVKSPPSCKTKVQTCKMDNSTCESPCEIHLCNLRYLQPT